MDPALLAATILVIGIFLLLAIGAPIAIAIGLPSLVALTAVAGPEQAVLVGAQRMVTGSSSFTLLAIPFFILAGNLMNVGGIAEKLIDAAKVLVGRLPGSLAQTNVVANALFGSVSGAGVAAAAAIGSTMAPRERREGYDPVVSAAANVASAPSGMLLPPSNTLIVYSLVSSTSVAALFVAGYGPGLVWVIACLAVVTLVARRRPEMRGTRERIPVAVAARALLAALPAILLDSARTTAVVMLLISVSSVLSWVLSFALIPQMVSYSLLGVAGSEVVILLLMTVILLVVGTFMDPTPAILIFTPIFLPIATELGVDPIHFGMIITFNLCLGTITPPVGVILFVGSKVGGVRVESVSKALLPYFAALIVGLLLVLFVPQISLALPELLGVLSGVPE